MVRKETAKLAGSLEAYRNKRDPRRTNEPFGAERKGSAGTLSGGFVVHLHAATRRHYDLRLEVAGRLMSFALPRGPSLDPKDKRLAVNTEDHPLEYLDFEDVIPEGNYGAGAMIVWDTGSVRYLEGTAEEGIARAKIDFSLNGHKLRGRFGLIHTGARKPEGDPERNHWLLVKKEDEHASGDVDVTEAEPRSVLSGLTVEELAEAEAIGRTLVARAAALGAPAREIETRRLTPMLCASQDVPLDDPNRYYELKLDGVRIVADKRGRGVDLRYRKLRSATAAYPEIARAVAALPVDRVVLDGEVIAFDELGRPSFARLARRIHLTRPHDVTRARLEVPVTYMVFDILALGDRDLRELPLSERKALLAQLLPGRGCLRVLDHLEGKGQLLMAFCDRHDLEGVVAKQKDSPYLAGPKRYPDWVKVKRKREDDFVVVGYEESEKARKLRSLLLAAYDEGRLVLRGKAGSGLDDAAIDFFLKRLGELEIPDPPCEGEVTQNGPRHWAEPVLVARVEHVGLSESGALRFPVYRGLREDVDPEDCVLSTAEETFERSLSIPDVEAGTVVRAADAATRAKLTNQDKVFWPDEGYTKGNLCDYYASMAEALLPLLAERPIVLVRYPDGIAGKSFFQWNVPKGTPPWLRNLLMREEGERGKSEKRCFLVDDVDGLLHIANLGCIPIHVLAARQGTREHCDFITIDFDLGDQPFRHAVTLALSLREILDDLGLPGFPKTSGQTGLHVLVPMGPQIPFPFAKMLCELLGRLLVDRHRDIATMERVVERRRDRVYVDTGQTGRSRTIVAPYSVRAVRGAKVSTPLSWDEVHMALDPSRFHIFSVPERLRTMGDLLAPLLELRPDVPAAVQKLERYVVSIAPQSSRGDT
ncbi:MAG: DNA ligase D [Myxococcales bacterium]|nr:DNA ligase D [Myxococcales bacterium]